MTGEHPKVGMDLHLKVQEVQADQARTGEKLRQASERHATLERRQDVIEQSYVRLENSMESGLRDVHRRIDDVQESNLDMHEASFGAAKQMAEQFAALVDYVPEIMAHAQASRWWARTWAMLKSISVKIGILAAIAGPIWGVWRWSQDLPLW